MDIRNVAIEEGVVHGLFGMAVSLENIGKDENLTHLNVVS
jgi:hypothetical protein